MSKKDLYEQVNKELAEKYNTRPEIIAHIRKYSLAGFKLIPLQDHVEEKIQKVQESIEVNRAAIERKKAGKIPEKDSILQKKIEAIQFQIDLNYKRKAFLLDVYTFLKRVGDEKFKDITRLVSQRKL